MSRSVEKLAAKAFDINMRQPFDRMKTEVGKQNNVASGISTGVGEFVKEAALLPLQNIGVISSWGLKQMAKVLGGSVKLGLQGLSLIPLPIPGGKKGTSIADLRGRAVALRQTIDIKAQGSPENFKDIFDRIRGVRNDAALRATGKTQAA